MKNVNQATSTIGVAIRNRDPANSPSSVNPTAMATAPAPGQIRYRRISRMIDQYSSAGIWAVFQRRPHSGQVHRSPYATERVVPQSQLIVIGAPRIRPSPHDHATTNRAEP